MERGRRDETAEFARLEDLLDRLDYAVDEQDGRVKLLRPDERPQPAHVGEGHAPAGLLDELMEAI
jgi:hypothetical protein